MNGTKKIKSPKDLFPLVTDRLPEEPEKTTFTKMNREETFEAYKRNGKILEEWELDKIMRNAK